MRILILLFVRVAVAQQDSGPTQLKGAPAADRDFQGLAAVDVSYRFHVAPHTWANAPNYTHATAMEALHGGDVWRAPGLRDFIARAGAADGLMHGSRLTEGPLRAAIAEKRPRVLLEVGVFRGATSIAMARALDAVPGLEDSFVLSMDTWLLDLRFQWNGRLSTHAAHTKGRRKAAYFKEAELAGSSLMYWTFLSNVLANGVSHRIIPLRTASSNGALALLSHQIRPDIIYLDASHANPDVLIDIENFFTILRPGGVLFLDDVRAVPAVRAALMAFCRTRGLPPPRHIPSKSSNQARVDKPADWP